MKKFYTSILFVFGFVSGFSQVNAYFQNNPIWHESIQIHPWNDMECYCTELNYYVNGDTIIGIHTYKKIFKNGTTVHTNVSGMPLSSTTFIGENTNYYLRSDSSKIYVTTPTQTNQLLYDFNFSVGDTIQTPEVSGLNLGLGGRTVLAIDSISTSFGFLKRFKISGLSIFPNLYLYEGIGTSAGLFEHSTGGFESFWNLSCFALDNTVYVSTPGGPCSLSLDVDANEEQTTVSAFPNPFSIESTLQLSKELKDAVLKIYNVNGQQMRNISFSGNNVVIKRDDLSAGFYYYRVQSDNKNLGSGKLAIID